MKYVIAFLLLLSTAAWGQKYCAVYDTKAQKCLDQPAALKCGKDQHPSCGICTESSCPVDAAHCQCATNSLTSPTAVITLGPKITPADCDKKYEYAAVTAHDKGYKEVCIPIPYIPTKKEWQELQEEIQWERHLRHLQCPSLSWAGGKCLPFCDELKGSFESCAHRKLLEKEPKP